MKPRPHTVVTLPLLAALVVIASRTTVAVAAETYLATNQPDGIALLPPPPHSAEQAADLASSRGVFLGATAEQKEKAEKAELTIFKFEAAIGDFWLPGRIPKTEALFKKVEAGVYESFRRVKAHWKRARPCQMDPALQYGRPESDSSYPSGHAAIGTVHALILSRLFPGQREAILEIGRQTGWDRVLIGKHYPTDIFAGRTLGRAIVRELESNADFQRDFVKVRAEVERARRSKPPLHPNKPTAIGFAPILAKHIRLTVSKASSGNEPGLDEVEVFTQDGTNNLALAATGARATASSCIAGYAIHTLQHLNDGQYGNDHCWIAGGSTGWVQVELSQPAVVSRVVVSRDRTGLFRDRMPNAIGVAVSGDGRTWQQVALVTSPEPPAK